MLKIERIDGAMDVSLRGEPEELTKEWTLLTSALLTKVPVCILENMLKVAAKNAKSVEAIDGQQSTQFKNRLAHLMESKG